MSAKKETKNKEMEQVLAEIRNDPKTAVLRGSPLLHLLRIRQQRMEQTKKKS